MICFLYVLPVPSISLGTKWALNVSWMNEGKRESCYFLNFLPKRKKEMVSFSGLCSLMNFPSYGRFIFLSTEILQNVHAARWGSGFPFTQQRPGQCGLLPPILSLHQTSCNFYSPSSGQLTQCKNSTLWHLRNKITSWPEYTFGRGMTQNTPSCPWTQISSVGHHSISVHISNEPGIVCSPGEPLQWEAVR